MYRARRPMFGKTIFVAVHRRQVYFLAFAFLLALTYIFASGRDKPVHSIVRDEKAPVVTVAIDAGHGGRDPGAIGVAGTIEKDVTLAIALKLEQTLKQAGMLTVMTRTTDDDLIGDRHVPHRQRADLIARAELVNSSAADVFVSLHANSFPNESLRGAQTFHLDGDDAGWRLAVHIQNALVRGLGPNRRRATSADLRILSDVEVPAAVVEVGFLTNPQEEQLLNDDEYQERVARAIADGIVAYVEEQPRWRSAPTVPTRTKP